MKFWLSSPQGEKWLAVSVAPSEEAQKAAVAFANRVREANAFGEYMVLSGGEETPGSEGHPYEILMEMLSPTCEHGMSAQLCMGPQHYPSAEQERMMGW